MLVDGDMKPIDDEGNEIDNEEDEDNHRIWLINSCYY